jgi:hypothetical protein
MAKINQPNTWDNALYHKHDSRRILFRAQNLAEGVAAPPATSAGLEPHKFAWRSRCAGNSLYNAWYYKFHCKILRRQYSAFVRDKESELRLVTRRRKETKGWAQHRGSRKTRNANTRFSFTTKGDRKLYNGPSLSGERSKRRFYVTDDS